MKRHYIKVRYKGVSKTGAEATFTRKYVIIGSTPVHMSISRLSDIEDCSWPTIDLTGFVGMPIEEILERMYGDTTN